MRTAILLGFISCILPACGMVEPYEKADASCLNWHVAANYGSIREIPGGFEIVGSGVSYTTIEITQPAAGLRPGAYEPAESYPKPMMRDLACKAVD